MSKGRSSGKKNSVGKKLLYAFTSILGVVVILMSVAYGFFYHYYNKLNIVDANNYGYVSDDDYYSDVTPTDDVSSAEEEVDPVDLPYGTKEIVYDFNDPDITNIMIVGTDSRKRGLWRTASDAMIIVSINKRTNKMFFTSFMRDTLVEIPKGGNHREAGLDKLNAAFAYGGSKLMFKTYEKNFGIKLDKFVHVDFYNFVHIVGFLGGVDMYITSAEIKWLNDYYMNEVNMLYGRPYGTDYLPVKSGTYHLNGKQALCYSRIRAIGGDYQRTERQRKVMEALLQKVKKLSATKLSKFAERSLRCVSTNLSETDVMSLLMGAPEYLEYENISVRIPIDKTYHSGKKNGRYVLNIDLKKNSDYWYSLVYLDKDISKEIEKKIAEEEAEAKAAEEAAAAASAAETSSSASSEAG